MTFNRSNTAWTVSPYEPDTTKIGSDNLVGAVRKTYLKFDNQTNKDYLLYFDFSSSANQGHYYEVSYNSTDMSNAYIDGFLLAINSTNFTKLYIPAYTNFEVYGRENSVANYLDAWYLKDLGVSAAYDAGFDAGEVVGYEDGYNNSVSPLWDGLEVAVGVTLNFILFIATLSIFDISLLNIGIVLVSILGLVWVLKALRG
jgi:hypothetical protein